MYNQFFGNYLFSKGYVTKEHLLSALIRQTKEMVHISMLALYNGYMSAPEVEYVTNLQKEEHKKFSEIAIEYGFLSQEQVLSLLNTKAPDFLVLGQILIHDGVFTFEQFENILTDYRSNSELLDMELNPENGDEIQQLLNNFSLLSESDCLCCRSPRVQNVHSQPLFPAGLRNGCQAGSPSEGRRIPCSWQPR